MATHCTPNWSIDKSHFQCFFTSVIFTKQYWYWVEGKRPSFFSLNASPFAPLSTDCFTHKQTDPDRLDTTLLCIILQYNIQNMFVILSVETDSTITPRHCRETPVYLQTVYLIPLLLLFSGLMDNSKKTITTCLWDGLLTMCPAQNWLKPIW